MMTPIFISYQRSPLNVSILESTIERSDFPAEAMKLLLRKQMEMSLFYPRIKNSAIYQTLNSRPILQLDYFKSLMSIEDPTIERGMDVGLFSTLCI